MKAAFYPECDTDFIQALLHGPANPKKHFVQGGATFGEVQTMAANLCTALDAADPQSGVVCLAAENKAVIAAALLASLAGGPTLLLPYAFSAHALAQLQQTTGFTTAIADTGRDFPAGVKILCPQTAGSGKISISSKASPLNELLRIFTGGSTGTPQVWSKTAANLFGEGLFLANHFSVTERDTVLATVPPYHIYGLLFSVILPLVAGATVVGESPSFPGEILRAAEENQVTILASVPAHYRVLGDKAMSLRLAFSSAGMLDGTDNELFCRNNPAGIIEVYGSTETGGIATRNRSLGEEYFTPFPTISWKTDNSRLAVHSPYISPDLPVDAAGYFTTNDRVESGDGKRFSLKGRSDTVTKVGGKRVDLEEVKALIKGQSGVVDCVVLAFPDSGSRGHRIGALVEGDATIMPMVLKALAESLEPYALPRRIKHVGRIPLSKNGKYDWTAIVQLLQP